MEIVGGFMVMMSILGFFLDVIWLIMPFVVLAMKGKQDRALELLEAMDKRLTAIEYQLRQMHHPRPNQEPAGPSAPDDSEPPPDQTSGSTVLPLA